MSRCLQWCLTHSGFEVSVLPAWGKAELPVPSPGKWLLVYSGAAVIDVLNWGGGEDKKTN